MINSIEPYRTCFQSGYNYDISGYDDHFLLSIINDRKRELEMVSDSQYLNHLETCSDEAFVFRGRLTNSYSEFFRNPLTFAYLEQVVLPQLIEKKRIRKENEIRIWSAACASGQEPYSLAMLFEDYAESHASKSSFRLFATDNSSDQIETAKMGIFSFDTIRNVKFRFINEYFSQIGEKYAINDKIKSRIDFSVFNLLDETRLAPPASVFGDFDLVMCSNVLFYYKPPYQKFIIEKLNRALKPGGIFITGEAEGHLLDSAKGFKRYASPAPIFIKN